MLELDGLVPLTCRQVRERLEHLGFYEDPEFEEASQEPVKVFRRPAMVGTPYYPLVWRSDDSMVYPPTIEHMLAALGISRSQFMAPRLAG